MVREPSRATVRNTGWGLGFGSGLSSGPGLDSSHSRARVQVLSLCLPHALELELLTTHYLLLTTYYSLPTTHLPHALELELVDVVVEEGLELLEQLGALLLRVGLVPGQGQG